MEVEPHMLRTGKHYRLCSQYSETIGIFAYYAYNLPYFRCDTLKTPVLYNPINGWKFYKP